MMLALDAMIGSKLATLPVPTALVLPGGRKLGAPQPRITIGVNDLRLLPLLTAGQIGALAEAYVEGRLEINGSMREVMDAAAALLPDDPVGLASPRGVLGWWNGLMRHGKSLSRHTRERDARQIQFHYDVSDDFYALWLDPRRVYSCAYFREPGMTLAQAQEAKLDHICRKLMLQPGERFLDIGAGWGGLLLWAAEHYGVQAHGVTLSKNQHAHVNRLVEERGLRDRVTMELRDYRDIDEAMPFDKIASVGMFEHVGRAQLVPYFDKIRRLLRPGGLLMNHGITSGGVDNTQLGAGMGDFIDRYIFPGGELVHVSQVLSAMSQAGLEGVDTENLRPHYARTLWAWSDALESNLDTAYRITRDSVVRAYRLYLSGCAMSFERGWISLHQMLASRPSGDVNTGPMRGSLSAFPFQREYMYR